MKARVKENLFGNRYLLTAVNAAFLLMVIAAVLFFIRDALSISTGLGKRQSDAVKGGLAEDRHNLQDYALILKDNPFGFPAGELKPLSGPVASSVRPDISLVGTVSWAKGGGYAIFADMSGAQEVFAAGAEVYGMGRLERVEKDRVYIKAPGSSVEIVMEEAVPGKDPRKGEASRERGSPPSQSQGFAKKISEGSYTVDKARIRHAIDNMTDVMSDARLMPYVVDGKQSGFMINEMKNNGVFQSMGLQNNDILLRVNDYDISNAEAALQAFSALKGMDRVQLDIIRNGSKTTMTYQIR